MEDKNPRLRCLGVVPIDALMILETLRQVVSKPLRWGCPGEESGC